jgi:cell division protein FtsB
MKWLVVGLALVIVLLQYRIWLSEDGVRDLDRLHRAVAAQRSSNDQLAERNRQLAAEVRDLKTGLAALEERARSDLGMIASHETFYQVVPPSSPVPAGSPAPASPAARSSTRTAAAH